MMNDYKLVFHKNSEYKQENISSIFASIRIVHCPYIINVLFPNGRNLKSWGISGSTSSILSTENCASDVIWAFASEKSQNFFKFQLKENSVYDQDGNFFEFML